VPDASKPKVVGDLLAAFFDPDASPALRVRLARLLMLLDQLQYELDHPEDASKREQAEQASASAAAAEQASAAAAERRPGERRPTASQRRCRG
jgi:hypothetical protein